MNREPVNASEPSEQPTAYSPRVLIVDDDDVILEYLTTLFRKFGYKAKKAKSSLEALEVAKRFEPEVMVLDYVMPGSTGLQTAVQIRKIRKFRNIPAVIFSGFKKEFFESEEGRHDWVTFVEKPVEFKGLEQAVRLSLENKKKKEMDMNQ